jgi:glycosyltransferase involved in cell wall biosynthesis
MAFLYKRSARIVVNSPGFIPVLVEDYDVPQQRVCLVPNGVDVSQFDPLADGGEIREEHGWADRFVVLYAGAHGPANDLTTVLDAASLLQEHPDIHLALLGDGKEKPALMQTARRRGLGNVTFLPPCSKSEIPQYLAAADACLAGLRDIPMFRTTYPNKVFDYMAAGRPTVLAIDGVIREVMESAEGGIFAQPGDPEAMASAIVQLYRRADGGRSLGLNARRYVAAHFDRQRQVQQLEELLTDVVGEHGTGKHTVSAPIHGE